MDERPSKLPEELVKKLLEFIVSLPAEKQGRILKRMLAELEEERGDYDEVDTGELMLLMHAEMNIMISQLTAMRDLTVALMEVLGYNAPKRGT